jgi:hypothetical protein
LDGSTVTGLCDQVQDVGRNTHRCIRHGDHVMHVCACGRQWGDPITDGNVDLIRDAVDEDLEEVRP